MGYSFIQVETVRMGRYDIYDDTNRFCISPGFRELEVFPALWDEGNPCQVYVMYIDPCLRHSLTTPMTATSTVCRPVSFR